MSSMIARSHKIARCSYGCCNTYRVKPKSRRIGKKMVKVIEKRGWKKEVADERD